MARHCVLILALVSVHAEHPVRQDLVDRINQKNLSWSAHSPRHNPLATYSKEDIQGLMGLLASTRPSEKRPLASELGLGDFPKAFDARDKWPSCKKPIRNQAHCGSCWAFAAAETLTDNLCVLGTELPGPLSPQELVSCDTTDHGCHGGTLPNAWDFIDSRGLVSDSCMPYSSGDGKSNGTCSLPACSGASSSQAYKCPDKHATLDSDKDIQAAVLTVGAVEVGFTVYEDFVNYKSGIYQYTEGRALGGHAVKIVGWGNQIEKFYWIVQNSWGESWGENGYFRIVNWHTDMKSAIAIGGGFACVHGATPAPPTPSPPPEQCKDIVDYCAQYTGQCASKPYLVPICKKTCGCCDALKPPYCHGAIVV